MSNTSASARFSTGPVIVTGNTPDELEAQALTRAAAASGLPAGLLAVYSPYTLLVTADHAHLPENQVSEAIRQARTDGSKLAAKIAVLGYRETDDDHGRYC